ncbi:AraC family transcriptional regulator [Photobacterium kishitanii]|uniref:AraC family transcriptional regulator n=1 Tax=Photobacterium kishitanii TaxID=318456 RepID=UPI0004356AD6|nr:AraC family transcriptional regulator [Photobacterium kishitanii]CEO41837.1 Bacterial regulatory helix-turn-helix s, AraC family protein [Photobacterium kishitanii]
MKIENIEYPTISQSAMIPSALITLAASLCEHYGLAHQSGRVDTYLAGIRLFRIDGYRKYSPQMYEQGIVIIIQGRKIGHLNQYQFNYDPQQCLLVTTPYPIVCETFASFEQPLMGINIDFDITVISQLVTMIESQQQRRFNYEGSCGVATTGMTQHMYRSVEQLLEVLHDPLDAQVIGPSLIRQLFYYLLQSEQGYLLAQYCEQDSVLAKISAVIDYVQQHYDTKLHVHELAAMAGMSVSVFHKVFKQVVTDPPMQYIKKIRLNNAKTLMLQHGMAANVAAGQVGYESPTQFSREFKRYFGLPPSKIHEHTGFIR